MEHLLRLLAKLIPSNATIRTNQSQAFGVTARREKVAINCLDIYVPGLVNSLYWGWTHPTQGVNGHTAYKTLPWGWWPSRLDPSTYTYLPPDPVKPWRDTTSRHITFVGKVFWLFREVTLRCDTVKLENWKEGRITRSCFWLPFFFRRSSKVCQQFWAWPRCANDSNNWCPTFHLTSLVGGFKPIWKILHAMDHLLNVPGKNKKCLKPPPGNLSLQHCFHSNSANTWSNRKHQEATWKNQKALKGPAL